MNDDTDNGGEAACSAAELSADGLDGRSLVEHDIDAIAGSGGAVWSLPHDGDLDANLVRLEAGQSIAEHVNNEVDVLIVVRSGSGEVVIDGVRHALGPRSVAYIRKGAGRTISAGQAALAYLTVHRRRGPLTIP